MEKIKLEPIESKDIIPSKKTSKTIENFLPKSITLDKENSTITSNQCGVISSIGLVYIYTSSSLFIFNNKNLETLIKDNSLNINTSSLCSITFQSQILQISHNNTHIFILCRDTNFISLISIKDVLTQNEPKIESTITFNNQIKKFMILQRSNDIIVLTKEGKLIYKSKDDLKEKPILQTCIDFDIGIIITAFDNENVYIISLDNLSIKHTVLVKNIKNDPAEKFNTISIIKHYIIITTTKEFQDNVYFIQIDGNKYTPMKIYYEDDEFYYIDEDNMNKCKNHRIVFPHYIPSLNVLFIIDKQYDKIEKLFIIEDKNIKEISLNDDNQPNTILKDYKENFYIGFNVINFKFKTYESNDTMINSIKYSTPLLCINVGFQGGIQIFYLINEKQNDNKCILNKVQSDLFEKQIVNKHVSLNISSPSSSTSNLNMFNLQSFNKIINTNDSKTNEKDETKKLITDKQDEQLNITRNQTLKNIKINLLLQSDSIKQSTLIPSIDHQLKNVETKLNEFNKCNSLLIDLSSQATKYFNDKPTINNTIQQQKQMINDQKASLYNLNINYKEAEKILKQITNIKITEDTSLIQVLSSNELRSFFGADQCNKLKTIVQDVNKYMQLFQEQQNIYEIILKIFTTFYKEISNIKKECDNYIKYQKMFAKYSNNTSIANTNQLSKKDYEARMQNDILNKYLNVFKLLYNELKNLYDNCLFDLIQQHKCQINEDIDNDVTNNNNHNQVAIVNKEMLRYNKINMLQLKQRTNESKSNSFGKLKEMIMNNNNCVVTYVDSSECFDVGCLIEEQQEKEEEINVDKYDDKKLEMINERVKELKLEKEKFDKEEKERKEKEEEVNMMKKKVNDMYRLNMENIKKYEDLAKRAEEIKEEENKLEKIKKTNEDLKNQLLKKEKEEEQNKLQQKNAVSFNSNSTTNNEKKENVSKETNSGNIFTKETNEQKDKDKDKDKNVNKETNTNVSNTDNSKKESGLFTNVSSSNNNAGSSLFKTETNTNNTNNLNIKTTSSGGGIFGNITKNEDNKTNNPNNLLFNLNINSNSNNNKETKKDEPKKETQPLQNSAISFGGSNSKTTSSLFSPNMFGKPPEQKETTPSTPNIKPQESKPKEEPKPSLFQTPITPSFQQKQNPPSTSQPTTNNNNQQQQQKPTTQPSDKPNLFSTNTQPSDKPNPFSTAANLFSSVSSSSQSSLFGIKPQTTQQPFFSQPSTTQPQQTQPTTSSKPQSTLFSLPQSSFTQQLPQQPQSTFGQHGFASSTNTNPTINKNAYNLTPFGSFGASSSTPQSSFLSFGTNTNQPKSSFASFSTGGTSGFFSQTPAPRTEDKSNDFFQNQ